MGEAIGAAGRAARDLARRRLGALPAPSSVHPLPLPLVQAAAETEADTTATSSPAPAMPPAAPSAAAASERETTTVTAEEVAERVYRLFCRDLRLERERQGR